MSRIKAPDIYVEDTSITCTFWMNELPEVFNDRPLAELTALFLCSSDVQDEFPQLRMVKEAYMGYVVEVEWQQDDEGNTPSRAEAVAMTQKFVRRCISKARYELRLDAKRKEPRYAHYTR